jgi:hypothetical protein
MKFVQIIEYHSSKPDEVTKLHDEFRAVTEGKRLATRVMECVDRNDPTRRFTIVEFPSYEAAMKNSALPETAAMSEKMMKVADGPPIFYDLDLVRVDED